MINDQQTTHYPFLNADYPPKWEACTPDRIKPDMEEGLRRAQEKVEQIASQSRAHLSFGSTVGELESLCEELGEAWGKVGHLQSVSDSDELRAAYNEMLPLISDFFSQLYLNEALWDVMKAYADTDDAAHLPQTSRRLLEETLQDFRESGAELPESSKQRLAEINKELAHATQQFSENVLDATNAWEWVTDDPTQLEGLPESAKEAARGDALAKGYGSEQAPQWRFTLQMPSLLPALTYLDDRSLREMFWRANAGVGETDPHDNSALIQTILALRNEKADVLGWPQFAELVTHRRMMGSGQQVLDFTEKMHGRVKHAFDEEVQKLSRFREEESGMGADTLEPWDIAYWSEKLRRAEYQFDEEDLRPYLPIDRVINGLFELAQAVFDVSITPRADVETWHEEVTFYEMKDGDGHLMGGFYADWYPRESKRGGAWFNPLQTGRYKENGDRSPHVGVICGNLTRPSGQSTALLTHREAETIFHEFGHLLHHLSGKTEHPSLSGVNVVWDFVELPSQLMENWCWERESLRLFARHHETGEPIPDELVEKMRAARTFQSAMTTMRQLSFGKLDMELHMHYAPNPVEDIDAFLDKQLRGYQIPYHQSYRTNIRRFHHLFSDATGYAAGYYSYKWSEVLEADCFTRFLKEGIMNADTGREFREKILSQGNCRPAESLYRDFMGRDPDEQALLRRSGL